MFSVGDCLNLDSAIINGEMQSHLVKAYDSLVSGAFCGYLYTEKGLAMGDEERRRLARLHEGSRRYETVRPSAVEAHGHYARDRRSRYHDILC